MPSHLALAGLLALISLVSSSPLRQDKSGDLATRLEAIRKEYKLVALAAAESREGKPLRLAVVGERKKGSGIAVSQSDQFHLGSCTKAMTATLLGLLVQEKKLRWEMTVVEGLPDIARHIHPDMRKVTLGMLLAHRSGLPRTTPKGWTLMKMRGLRGSILDARRNYAKALLSQEPLFAPDSKFAYSNAGYTVAAHFAEVATGKSWEELIRKRLFEPLGMKTAGFGPMGTKGKIDQPWQHRGTGRMLHAFPPDPLNDNPPVMAPAGLVHASMEDWGKFLALHAVSPAKKKSLLTLATWTWLHTRWKGQDYAPGAWRVVPRKWGGGDVLTHNGSNTMNAAVAWVAPEIGRALFAATNSAGRQEFAALDKAVALFLRRAQTEKTQTTPKTMKESKPRRAGQDSDKDAVQAAGELVGLDFTDQEAKQMLREVQGRMRGFERLRRRSLPNSVYPALTFTPFLPGIEDRSKPYAANERPLPAWHRPKDPDDLAFASIPQLAALIRNKEISCVELTKFFLKRLKKADRKLHCVITFTEKRALDQAAMLDEELAKGRWRGLLHGIPYGAKDLFAVKGYRTTWGAKPYEDQVLDETATVVERLDAAGAVLIAKTTLGALAMGDVWFGGMTRNPWNPERGSSGSSAGSASATAAGALPFALGTETLGSIISPSFVCGDSSLRPTFGRVSRHGAMALSWSMDKVGPLCRSARDAAIVFEAIQGKDPKDPSTLDRPFHAPPSVSVKGLRVGYIKGSLRGNDKILDELRALGVELVEITLPRYPARDMTFVLKAEGAAAFDELTRSNRDDLLVRQGANSWPAIFRAARLIPAVEYIQANRLRVAMMQDYDKALRKCDILVHSPYTGLAAFNLTGHPTFIAPYGDRRKGRPQSICFTGQLADEGRLLALAEAWQRATGYHFIHPPH